MVTPVFPGIPLARGMYESFYLRAVSPSEPVGAWIRYTVHKRPGTRAKGSLWCTVFDARRGAPFMHKHTTEDLSAPQGSWIAIGGEPVAGELATAGRPASMSASASRLGAGFAEGRCGLAAWQLRFQGGEPELRHLEPGWLYRMPLPRTKLTSPTPATRFTGTIELPGRTLTLDDWPGMVGHNWGAEHAARWIWLHGVGFEQDERAWIDVGLGRVMIAGRLTPWLASGAVSLAGQRFRVGGLGARGIVVAESPERCTVRLPAKGGLAVEARIEVPSGTTAGWRYADPDGGEHDVVNCSIAELVVNVRPRGAAATLLSTRHGGAYELGMREHDHGVPLAPFADG